MNFIIPVEFLHFRHLVNIAAFLGLPKVICRNKAVNLFGRRGYWKGSVWAATIKGC